MSTGSKPQLDKKGRAYRVTVHIVGCDGGMVLAFWSRGVLGAGSVFTNGAERVSTTRNPQCGSRGNGVRLSAAPPKAARRLKAETH
jgi:hypothetical protein